MLKTNGCQGCSQHAINEVHRPIKLNVHWGGW